MTKSNKIYVQGYNCRGELGLGLENHTSQDLPKLLELNFESDIKMIKCGGLRTMIITERGDCFACGDNTDGILGLGDTINRNTFQKLPIRDVTSVSFMVSSTFILTKLGCFVCGRNDSGQLGVGNNIRQISLQKLGLPNIISVECGESHAFALTRDSIYSWGTNGRGRLGLGHYEKQNTPQKVEFWKHTNTTARVVSIRCTENVPTLFLTILGELFVCGNHKKSYFHFDYPYAPGQIFAKLNWNKFVVSINCGHNHIIATTKNGDIYSWGYQIEHPLETYEYEPRKLEFIHENY
ncbi:MAG TPA: hypothetical protein VKR58_11670 [Aquella sp.]|nr:hypothetical protein [Aquella sp.]